MSDFPLHPQIHISDEKKKKKNTIPAKLWKYLIFLSILSYALPCLSISKQSHQDALINLSNGFLRESEFREKKSENFDQRWCFRCKAVSLMAIFF